MCDVGLDVNPLVLPSTPSSTFLSYRNGFVMGCCEIIPGGMRTDGSEANSNTACTVLGGKEGSDLSNGMSF